MILSFYDAIILMDDLHQLQFSEAVLIDSINLFFSKQNQQSY